MRIAIVGAHGVGKTTLTKRLSEKFYLNTIPDYAAIAFHNGFRVNEQTTPENQFWMLASQIENERKFQNNFVADKCILDNIVYANYLFSDERILTLIQEIVLSNLSYTHYFYVPIEFAIEADGRSLDVDFQKKVDLDYLNLLNELNIDYVEVCGSVENRLGLISETLRLEISEQNFIKA